MKRSNGFTLIEISIVLVIIGIILGMLFTKSGAVIGNAKTTDTIALVKDLNAAIFEFKNRYHYLPGDLPKAADDIAGLVGCDFATTTANIGDGKIDPTEKDCVAQELVRAGLIKGDASATGISTRSAGAPDVFVIARRSGTTLPATALNEIELINQPCEVAMGIDMKLDDGNLATGKIQASVASCTPGGSNDPVPFVDIAL